MDDTGNSKRSNHDLVIGIDIGTDSTKIVLGVEHGLEIVRNDVGGHSTPTCLKLGTDPRQARDIGISLKGNGAAKTKPDVLYHLNRQCLDQEQQQQMTEDLLAAFYPSKQASDNASFPTSTTTSTSTTTATTTVSYQGTPTTFDNAALLGMLLSKVKKNAIATWRRQQQQQQQAQRKADDDDNDDSNAANLKKMSGPPSITLALTCAPDISELAQSQLLRAGYIAASISTSSDSTTVPVPSAGGLDDDVSSPYRISLIDRSVAYQAVYSRKFPEHVQDRHVVLIVDMGHADTTVSILGPSSLPISSTASASASASLGKEEEKDNVTNDDSLTMKVLASRRQKGLGAGCVDVRLWNHFQSTQLPHLPSTSSSGSTTTTTTTTDRQPKSSCRGSQRLLEGVSKLKHLLSQLPEGNVTVENVGLNDTDVTLEGSRALLVEVCQPEINALQTLVRQTLKDAGMDSDESTTTDETHRRSIDSVEVVGGGCRMPWVKKVLEDITQKSLSYTLDDTSAALGGALVVDSGDCLYIAQRLSTQEATEEELKLRSQEIKMAQTDEALHQRSSLLNQMEAHLLGLRSAKHETHGEKLPAELFTYLDEVEDWMFSPEVDDASLDVLQAKWEEVTKQTNEYCADYQAKKDEERVTKEAEMEAEAKQAQKEREGEEADGDEEDHDNRRLPKKRRMEIVMKNKKEGGELFSDGNYKFSAARYAKALSHCAKFVDLSPEDTEEVNGVKLTLNLNLSLAYIKMKNLDQALRYANDAIAMDGNHIKALYRRASIYYEKKNWNGAYQDLKVALSGNPEDKALLKLQEKVDAQMKRQKIKEKKMAQKMFG